MSPGFFVGWVGFFVVERLPHVALDQKHELSYAYASLLGSQAKFGALRSIRFTQTSPTTVGAVHGNADKIRPPSRMTARYNCPRKNISNQAQSALKEMLGLSQPGTAIPLGCNKTTWLGHLPLTSL